MSLRQWIFADLLSEKFTQGVREIHASLARLSLSGICENLFFVVMLLFPLTFSDFSVSPVLSFCISAAQWHVVIAPCVHILWKSWRSVTVIPRHDAESRRHPDGTHCTSSGCGILTGGAKAAYTMAAFWIPLFSGMTT